MGQRTFRQMNANFYYDIVNNPILGHCKNCKHRQRWRCGGRFIQYCGITKSNRTFNGLKKIKVYDFCNKFEKENENE